MFLIIYFQIIEQNISITAKFNFFNLNSFKMNTPFIRKQHQNLLSFTAFELKIKAKPEMGKMNIKMPQMPTLHIQYN